MNIIRIFAFLTIFGLLFFSTTVFGQEDKVENDADIDEEDDNTGRTDETVIPSNDNLVRKKIKYDNLER